MTKTPYTPRKSTYGKKYVGRKTSSFGTRRTTGHGSCSAKRTILKERIKTLETRVFELEGIVTALSLVSDHNKGDGVVAKILKEGTGSATLPQS